MKIETTRDHLGMVKDWDDVKVGDVFKFSSLSSVYLKLSSVKKEYNAFDLTCDEFATFFDEKDPAVFWIILDAKLVINEN